MPILRPRHRRGLLLLMAAALGAAAADLARADPKSAPAPPDGSGGGATLELRFTGMKSSDGAVMAALFDGEAAYESGGKPVRAVRIPIADGAARILIEGLAPGRYAVKAFHDLKGDGKLAMNLFGVPLEPVAFSNNAKVKGKAPSWSETVFDLPPAGTRQDILID